MFTGSYAQLEISLTLCMLYYIPYANDSTLKLVWPREIKEESISNPINKLASHVIWSFH